MSYWLSQKLEIVKKTSQNMNWLVQDDSMKTVQHEELLKKRGYFAKIPTKNYSVMSDLQEV
jgi:hypothetical protein